MINRHIIFFILSVGLVLNIYGATELRSTQMRTSDGLPNNSIRYIYQDTKGFLWLATLNGLSRYDGNSFLTLDVYKRQVVPGDIKYKNVNGDEVIDANDVTAIGYSTAAPEIYYSFHLGAEWKGIGLDAMFQGTGNYSAVLNTKSMFWPLINNTSLSTHYYENRWTPESLNANYPRLSSQSNANNYQTNTIWLADRRCV